MELKEIEIEQRILDKARELFFFFGIKSITMEDISKHLGMSKKTLYTHFKDKGEIVNVIMGDLLKKHLEESIAANENSQNAIEEVVLQAEALYTVFKEVKPSVFFEVEKYFPSLSGQFIDHRYKCMLETIKANLQRGRNERIYREDFDIAFVSQIRLDQLVSAFDEKAYSKVELSIPKIISNLNSFYLNAICNEQGRRILSTYIKSIKIK